MVRSAVPSPATRPTGNIQARDAARRRATPQRRRWPHLGLCRRESIELARDKLRLAFAIFGPIVLLLAAAGVSFDVENVRFTVLDRDQSLASRELLEQFAGSAISCRRAVHAMKCRCGMCCVPPTLRWWWKSRQASAATCWPGAVRGSLPYRWLQPFPRRHRAYLCQRHAARLRAGTRTRCLWRPPPCQ
jgi:hypothetical protein